MAAPLKNENFENLFFYVTRGPKRDIEPHFHEHTTRMSKINPENRKWADF